MKDIVYFGDYGPYGAAHLRACLDSGHRVGAVVVTGKWQRRRRSERLVSLLAPRWSLSALVRRNAIPVIAVRRPVDGQALAAQLAPLGATLLVSAGFGARIPADVVALFPDGAINVHPTLLPNYRGPHPTLAMLRDGGLAENAGVTIHAVTEGFDEGPIVAQRALEDAGSMPPEAVDDALMVLGYRMLRETLPDLPARLAAARPQPAGTFPSGRVTGREISIEPGIADAELARLMQIAALGTYPRFVSPRDDVAIPLLGPVRRLGPATGAAPLVGRLAVEFDTHASRVRIPRARQFRRRRHRWRSMARLVRLPLG